ncbi:MAG: tetratricopeptide repeat protein [Gammaproteobacteria bacterium]|nr:tetratricopeptide repeat protein [Gammaproteobacteria bacterium]
MNEFFWLLLPVAAISGWIAATRHYKSIYDSNLPSSYSVTSPTKPFDNFVDTQPDNAVDTVIEKVEVSSETVEVHLALGNLYRRSGEVNRAIRFHQNLSEKHSLTNAQRESILFELGLDYLTAGLLDRAERIFKDLLTADEFQVESSKALIEVYQQEKDWDAAIEYAEMYELLSRRSQRTRIGQYYCEKAEKFESAANESDVKALLRLALKKDKACVRANILLGDLSLRSYEYEAALKYYMSAIEQDRTFLSVIFENVIQCLRVIAQNENLVSISPSSLSNELPVSSEGSMMEKTELYLIQKKATKYIEHQLEKAPTLSLLGKYLLLSLDDVSLKDRKSMSVIKDSLFKINKTHASYQCVSCGLGVHALQWQCPGCSNWSTIKPL